MAAILLTGMSGTGKSSAIRELTRRGYATVDTDLPGWCEWIVDGPDQGERLWREDRIRDLLDRHTGTTLFVAGCVANQGQFSDGFDAIVLLSAPLEVMLERIDMRTTNPFGKDPSERDRIVHDHANVEPLLRAGCTHEIDTRRPLDEVVEALIEIAEAAATRGDGPVKDARRR